MALLAVLAGGCDATAPGAAVDTEPAVGVVEPETGAVEGEVAEGEAVQREGEATAAADAAMATAAGTDATSAGTMGGVAGIPAGTFVRGQTLLGWNFENVDGKVSGEIEDDCTSLGPATLRPDCHLRI